MKKLTNIKKATKAINLISQGIKSIRDRSSTEKRSIVDCTTCEENMNECNFFLSILEEKQEESFTNGKASIIIENRAEVLMQDQKYLGQNVRRPEAFIFAIMEYLDSLTTNIELSRDREFRLQIIDIIERLYYKRGLGVTIEELKKRFG